jgi:hypothetical protein
MCKKNNPLLLFALICIIVSLFGALTPFSDLEQDGLSDSPGSDDFLLLPGLLTITGLILLLTRICSAYFAVPQLFSSLLVPPPNAN